MRYSLVSLSCCLLYCFICSFLLIVKYPENFFEDFIWNVALRMMVMPCCYGWRTLKFIYLFMCLFMERYIEMVIDNREFDGWIRVLTWVSGPECMQWPGLGKGWSQEPGIVWVSHMNDRDTSTWVLTCWLPLSALAENWRQEPDSGIKCCIPMWYVAS